MFGFLLSTESHGAESAKKFCFSLPTPLNVKRSVSERELLKMFDFTEIIDYFFKANNNINSKYSSKR